MQVKRRELEVAKIKMENCPFCGSPDVDPEGWVNGSGGKGPECMDCGSTARSVVQWNSRTVTVAADVDVDGDLVADPAPGSIQAEFESRMETLGFRKGMLSIKQEKPRYINDAVQFMYLTYLSSR